MRLLDLFCGGGYMIESMPRPLLYDLFSGAGGTSMGYYRAGFRVIGVDNNPNSLKHYPFESILMDVFEFMRRYMDDEYERAEAFAASPPCQGYSRLRHLPWLRDREYPMLIEPTREALQATGRPWVIENVEDAPLLNGITLCGTMFGLKVYRHRKFESNVLLWGMAHKQHEHTIFPGRMLNARYGGSQGVVGVFGHSSCDGVQTAADALGIDWMTRDELTQAIPPAYCEFIGRQLLSALHDGEHRLGGF